MITGNTTTRLDEVTDAVGRIVVGENGVLSFDGQIYKYRLDGIIYETDLDGNTKFMYIVPNRSKSKGNFIGEYSNHQFTKKVDNTIFRNPSSSVFDRFLNLDLLDDNDIDSFPEGFFNS